MSVAGCRATVVEAVLCVGGGALAGPAAGGAPAATLGVAGAEYWLTTTSLRSREAKAFATSAQTTAATMSVAASRICFLQFIRP